MEVFHNMFEVKKNRREEKVVKSFRISINLLDRLEEICKDADISLNSLIIMCIEYALDNMKPTSNKES